MRSENIQGHTFVIEQVSESVLQATMDLPLKYAVVWLFTKNNDIVFEVMYDDYGRAKTRTWNVSEFLTDDLLSYEAKTIIEEFVHGK